MCCELTWFNQLSGRAAAISSFRMNGANLLVWMGPGPGNCADQLSL